MTIRTQEQIERDPYGYEVEGNFLAAEGREMAGVTYEQEMAQLNQAHSQPNGYNYQNDLSTSRSSYPSFRPISEQRADPYGYTRGNPLDAEGREMAGVTYEEDKYRQMEERSKNSLSGFFYNY